MKNKLVENIKTVLIKYEFIEFVLIFGSYVEGTQTKMSDVDIAVYLSKDIDLLTVGKIISELEKVTNRKIDFVILNNLYSKNPLFAFEIINKSKLLFVRNSDLLVDYKTRTQLEYFDTEKLRDASREALRKRIADKKFGKRNYA